jgi:DNA-binding transcriptional LysR family regulator
MSPRAASERRPSRYFRMRDLELLTAISRHGSLAKAAQELAVSQPAVSKAVAELEAGLGVRLLDRNPRGAELTIYGALLLRSADATLSELQQCLRDLDALADPSTGEVRIGAPGPVAAGLLTDAVERFIRLYPRVYIEIVAASTRAGEFRELRERKVDLMVGRMPEKAVPDDVKAELLFVEQRFVVTGMQSQWARRRKVELADLVDAQWIIATPEEADTAFRDAFQSQGLTPPRPQIIAQPTQLRRNLLASGDFLAILSVPAIRSLEGERLHLKLLPIDLSMLDTPTSVVTMRNRTLSPAVERFIEFLAPVAAALTKKYNRAAPLER